MASERFDDFAKNYDAIFRESVTASGDPLEYFVKYKLDCLKRLQANSTAPVLDYGCGTGNVTEALTSHFTEVHGYDPSPESLTVARERVPRATFHPAIDDVPSGRFGSAVISGVLHHVPRAERKDVLAAVRDKLEPGGRVFVFEHNPLNPVTRHVVRVCPFDVDVELVYPWHARRLLEEAGFRDVTLEYIVFFPRVLAFLRRFEPLLGWFPAGAQLLAVGTR